VIQAIIDGIVAGLLAAFPDVKVYTEQVKQGLTEPCFIVRCLNPANEQFLWNRYRRTNLFTVQYIAESATDANEERYEVLDTLYRALEYIAVKGDLVRGTGMRGEFFDGVLTFFVNFNMFVKVESEIEPMEDLKIERMEAMA